MLEKNPEKRIELMDVMSTPYFQMDEGDLEAKIKEERKVFDSLKAKVEEEMKNDS